MTSGWTVRLWPWTARGAAISRVFNSDSLSSSPASNSCGKFPWSITSSTSFIATVTTSVKISLLERKELLKQILRQDETIRYSDHEIEKGKELYELALENQLEGILGKKIDSPYPEGRTTSWLKFKLVRELDAVVGGWTEPRGTREHFGALLLGLYDGKKLEFICGAGSGFSGELQERVASAAPSAAKPRDVRLQASRSLVKKPTG